MMVCDLLIHNIMKENEVWIMKQFTSYPLTANTEVNLHSVLMMWIIDSQYHQTEWSMIYETVQQLSINNNHWNELTVCIGNVGIVDSCYHERKWSMSNK